MSSRASGLDTSRLSKIENLENHPMDLFSKWVEEVRKHRNEHFDIMTLATLNK